MCRIIPYIFLGILLLACHAKKSMIERGGDFAALELREKYAAKLEVVPAEVNNITLYEFVDDWLNVKYQYGGSTKQGTDCSGFANALYEEVYQQTLARRSEDIAASCKKIKKDNLQEGDLVFFTINKGKISHVGIYLTNNYFVHASTSKGVIISNLNEIYYARYFWGGGRLKAG